MASDWDGAGMVVEGGMSKDVNTTCKGCRGCRGLEDFDSLLFCEGREWIREQEGNCWCGIGTITIWDEVEL